MRARRIIEKNKKVDYMEKRSGNKKDGKKRIKERRKRSGIPQPGGGQKTNGQGTAQERTPEGRATVGTPIDLVIEVSKEVAGRTKKLTGRIDQIPARRNENRQEKKTTGFRKRESPVRPGEPSRPTNKAVGT